MSQWFSRKAWSALALTIMVMMVLPWAALANDKLTSDADSVTAGPQQSYTNNSLAQGATAQFSFDLYVAEVPGGQEPTYPIKVDVKSKPSWVDAITSFPVTITGVGTQYKVAVTFQATGQASSASGNITFKALNGAGTEELGQQLINTTDSTFTVSVAPPPAVTDSTAPVISYTLNPASPDGSNGWYTSNVTLTWTVVDNESTISSSSGCDQVNITADQNATTYTCTATSAGGTASQSVSIKRDATAPVITPGDVNNTTWRNSALSQTFSASDATSGLANSADASFTLTASDESADASTPTVDSKTISDNAGNSATRTLSALIDLTDPTIQASLDKSAAATGWFNLGTGAPTVSFSCRDELSGLATACPSAYTFGEGANQSRSGSVSDRAGNSNSAGVSGINVDLTAPSNLAISINDGATWTNDANGAVSVDIAADDSLSKVASYKLATSQAGLATATPQSVSPAAANFSLNDVSINLSSGEGSAKEIWLQVCDAAGNCGTASDTIGWDKTKPVITLTTPANNARYVLNDAVYANYGCDDQPGLSGIKTCVGTVANGSAIDTATVGSKSFRVDAEDHAGNTRDLTHNYSVGYGTCLLFDNTRPVKAGAVLPIKLQLCDANNINLSSSSITVNASKIVKVSPTVDGALQDAGNANPDNNFRYDSTLQGYIYNLSTKGFGTGKYRMEFTASTTGSLIYSVEFEVK